MVGTVLASDIQLVILMIPVIVFCCTKTIFPDVDVCAYMMCVLNMTKGSNKTLFAVSFS